MLCFSAPWEVPRRETGHGDDLCITSIPLPCRKECVGQIYMLCFPSCCPTISVWGDTGGSCLLLIYKPNQMIPQPLKSLPLFSSASSQHRVKRERKKKKKREPHSQARIPLCQKTSLVWDIWYIGAYRHGPLPRTGPMVDHSRAEG